MLLEGKCLKFSLGFYFRGVEQLRWKIKNVLIDWEWFRCEVNQKCIHPKSRCDLHPHPACVYNNTETGKNKTETGEMVAEDEEGCLQEGKYRDNGLIDASANLECDSPVHNKDSAAIFINSPVFNWTKFDTTKKHTHKEIRSIFFPLPYEDGSRAVIGVK
jgi:hypothetical protein